ncbi:MAG: DUF87 domain-containing protein [Acidobacteria bacterium]|nr:DUF87 domain-containing protein [Acidobacteriota bacterium]
MTDAYEKLGAFYLGKSYDLASEQRSDDLLLFDSKDLTTHGVCFGMTGSGKTGLCICLLEEALIDNIPVIAIDPKGDLGDMLLNFPDLRAEDFRPWVQDSEARRKGLTPEAFAAKQAELWRNGLASWDQPPERIRKLRDAADMVIYTPGSEAGLPVSMLKSFAAPSEELRRDREQMRDRVQAAAGSLLGMLGLNADPVQSRDHILLSLLLDKAWQAGKDLSLAELIQQIQSPPVERVGVFDLESFYPSKERFGLAMALNNLLASPGFEAWMHGEPLDLDRMLYTPQGKPRLTIFSIAHLGDAERMFFVSTLLGETLSWMRRQQGTSALRALLYMDEIYGYLPPTANPPSKQPLMTLMKQARAFGLGVLLSTQNPKDLDYKALSNAGTWFIGRLQTDRDRDRVLDGLEGAAAGSGAPFDRAAMERSISGLNERVFVLYNVHEDAPVSFQTRWALSYLSGPLTRAQIETLMAPRKAALSDGEPAPAARAATSTAAAAAAPAAAQRPSLPPDVPQYFAPVRTIGPATARLGYEPHLYGAARLNYADAKLGVNETRDFAALTALTDGPDAADWQDAEASDLASSALESAPADQPNVDFGALPSQAARAKSYATWSKRFAAWVYSSQELTLFRSPSLGETSRPGESEAVFRNRLALSGREERDRQVAAIREKYASKIARIQERIRRAEQTVEKEKEQASSQTMQSVLSIGSSILGAVFGRKILSATNAGKVGTAARSFGRIGKERSDVNRAEENLEALLAERSSLEAEIEEAVASCKNAIDPLGESLEPVAIRLKKTAIDVRLLALVWLPVWQGPAGERSPAWK